MTEQFMQPVTLLLGSIILLCIGVIFHLNSRLRSQRYSYQPKVVQLQTPDPDDIHAFGRNGADADYQPKTPEELLTSQTFHKFVPKQFVDHFAKQGTSQLELGKADEDDVAILFCDIRGFTTLSERMSPQELMNFLNSYFLRMNHPIHKNGGFIDKFIGDAIMSLFDHPGGSAKDKAKDAIAAAMDLRKEIFIYNQHRHNSGYPPINIGIGIHYGEVILGTVGSHDRMDTTVIGDSVNIAYRLESLTPIYNCDIIVSAQLLECAEAFDRVECRLIDWVRVKGKRNAVEIYEIYDHQPAAIKAIKKRTGELIAEGIEARKAQDWDTAMAKFQEAKGIDPLDQVITRQIEHITEIQQNPIPENWDGSYVL